MGYGKHNDIVMQLGYFGQITGGAAEADIAGSHLFLPFKAELVDVRVACRSVAADCATTLIQVYQDGLAAAGTAVLTAGMDPVDGAERKVGVIANPGKHYPKGTWFCLSENATNTKVFDDPMVFMTFRKLLP